MLTSPQLIRCPRYRPTYLNSEINPAIQDYMYLFLDSELISLAKLRFRTTCMSDRVRTCSPAAAANTSNQSSYIYERPPSIVEADALIVIKKEK